MYSESVLLTHSNSLTRSLAPAILSTTCLFSHSFTQVSRMHSFPWAAQHVCVPPASSLTHVAHSILTLLLNTYSLLLLLMLSLLVATDPCLPDQLLIDQLTHSLIPSLDTPLLLKLKHSYHSLTRSLARWITHSLTHSYLVCAAQSLCCSES